MAANQVLALLVLDNDANRLAIKYCSSGKKHFPTIADQQKFEKQVIRKLPKPNASGRASEGDVALVNDLLVLYKICNDVYTCVVCTTAENELIVGQLLEGL